MFKRSGKSGGTQKKRKERELVGMQSRTEEQGSKKKRKKRGKVKRGGMRGREGDAGKNGPKINRGDFPGIRGRGTQPLRRKGREKAKNV